MSAYFTIYPGNNRNILFGDLLEEFKKNIKDFFLKNDIYISTLMCMRVFIIPKGNRKTELIITCLLELLTQMK